MFAHCTYAGNFPIHLHGGNIVHMFVIAHTRTVINYSALAHSFAQMPMIGYEILHTREYNQMQCL